MARMSIFNPNMAKLLPKFMKADETDVALSHAMDVLKFCANGTRSTT